MNCKIIVILLAVTAMQCDAEICNYRHCTVCGEAARNAKMAKKLSPQAKRYCETLRQLPDCCENYMIYDQFGTAWNKYY